MHRVRVDGDRCTLALASCGHVPRVREPVNRASPAKWECLVRLLTLFVSSSLFDVRDAGMVEWSAAKTRKSPSTHRCESAENPQTCCLKTRAAAAAGGGMAQGGARTLQTGQAA